MQRSKSLMWEKILDSSEEMQQVAARQDWDLLQQLIEQRQKLLKEFFRGSSEWSGSQGDNPDHSPSYSLEQIRRDIDEILAQDALIRARSAKTRDLAATHLKRLSKGKQATRLYT
jgi:hypothetical protein